MLGNAELAFDQLSSLITVCVLPHLVKKSSAKQTYIIIGWRKICSRGLPFSECKTKGRGPAQERKGKREIRTKIVSICASATSKITIGYSYSSHP